MPRDLAARPVLPATSGGWRGAAVPLSAGCDDCCDYYCLASSRQCASEASGEGQVFLLPFFKFDFMIFLADWPETGPLRWCFCF